MSVFTGSSPVGGDRRAALGLLVLAYASNFVDRTIVNTIGQAIKEDLRLTDTELGLLGGLAFAALYTVLGVPIARLADRGDRVGIMAGSIAVWSAFTAACGAAASYGQLLFFRVGVGVGEAGLVPPAHSWISDAFEPKRRASALSVFSLGIPLGVLFGAVAGGWIADRFSWRAAFVLVGLPGLLIALAVALFVPEPRRGGRAAELDRGAGGSASGAGSLGDVLRAMRSSSGLVHVVAGCTLVSLAGYGMNAYSQAYFLRAFGISYTEVGLVFGLIGGVGMGMGTFLGGWLADRLGSDDRRWHARVPGVGVASALPLYVLAFTADDWRTAAGLLFLPGVLHYFWFGPTFGLVQNAVPAPMRATAAALVLFVLNLVGLGLGPPLCGWLIDRFSASRFASVAPGTFEELCPGGIGVEGTGAALDALCRQSVATGTRWGILLMLAFLGWGALHYALAALRLARTNDETIRA